jgi:hypothetical protein
MQLFPLLNMVLMVKNPLKSAIVLACIPLLHFFIKTFRVPGQETRPATLVLKVKRHD